MFALLPRSKLDKFFMLVEWTTFVALAIAAYYVTIEVWEQYQSCDTNFKRSKELVTAGPTMVINFWPAKIKDTGKEFENDFTLSFSIDGRSDKKILHKGINIIEISDTINIQVQYEVLKFLSDPRVKYYHKISSDYKLKGESAEISIHFNESIPARYLPRVAIYMTSEKNAYGRYGDDYFEG